MKISNSILSNKMGKFLGTARYGFLLGAVFILKSAPLQAQDAQLHEEAKQDNLELLLAGNKRFVHNQSQHPHLTPDRLAEVSKGQHPFAVVISCSDSRVPPELVFDQGLGDLFVIRTAGNTLSPIELGSVEYAVEHLHTPLIIVMGHENCGAIKAVEENAKETGNLGILLANIKNEPEVKRVKPGTADRTNVLVQANVRHVVKQLQSQKGVLGEKFRSGYLQIVGVEYFLNTGMASIVSTKK